MFIKYILISIFTYLSCNLIEHTLHRLSHNRHIPLLYKWHHYHHTVEFPPYRLINNNHKYDSIIYNYYLYIVIIIYLFTYLIINDWYIQTIIYVEGTLYMHFANLLHESYHRDNSFFERFGWFQKKKKLHLLHHIKTTRNFNLFDNTTDKMVNTFKRSKSI